MAVEPYLSVQKGKTVWKISVKKKGKVHPCTGSVQAVRPIGGVEV